MPRPIPDPTIMTNFLTMAETTVCKATPVLLEWVRGVAGVARLNFARAPRDGMSNPSTRRGAQKNPRAIIPFVNKTLTSGAPIASSPEIVNEFNSCESVNGTEGARMWTLRKSGVSARI